MLAALLLASTMLLQQEPDPLASTLTEVTVYGGSASVKRRAALPAGDGHYVLQGLPQGLDPRSVRVRLEGGEVISVEVRDRFQPSVPDERVEALRERIRAAEREVTTLEDDRAVLALMQEHIVRLLRDQESDQTDEVAAGVADPKAWDRNYVYLAGKLGELKRGQRELLWVIEAKNVALNDLRLELGRFQDRGGARLKDVVIDTLDTRGEPGTLELEYVVANAGWEPYYDLRAAKNLSGVELVYRARVWQRTGEDWRDADVLLSTAQPQRGTQGPEPQPVWLALAGAQPGPSSPGALKGLGYAGAEVFEASQAPDRQQDKTYDTEVLSEGLSVRFRLPRKETVESRDQPTTVLIGRASLDVTPEHYCVPALDNHVWLRALTTNSSPFAMLPGEAAVYFGADFVGHASVGAVQVGEEFTLYLGADPGLSVERTQLADKRHGSGLFSSKASQRAAWRIQLENHGAFTARPDGTVEVIVHETLPRSTDERIKVSIEEVSPALSEAERWRVEREEKGTLTWVVSVPRGGERRLELTTEVKFPEKQAVVRR